MSYTIRKALPGDRENVLGLKLSSIRPYVEEIWGWDEAYQRADFDSDYLKCGEFLIIEVEHEFAGFMQLVDDGNRIENCEIHLCPAFRGNGIGSSILRQIMGNTEGRVISLGCFKKNERARNLYLRLGFAQTKESETHYLFEFTS